jgi:hypothetical protein
MMILGDYEIFHDNWVRIVPPDTLGWRIGNVLEIGYFEYTVIEAQKHQILLDRPLERSLQHGTRVEWVRNCRVSPGRWRIRYED